VTSELRREADDDLVMVLLTCTLAGLRDKLLEDGYDQAGRVVADLVEITDDYLDRSRL
jgi:hypothetical protein